MGSFLRMLLGVALLPAVWGCAVALIDVVCIIQPDSVKILPPAIMSPMIGVAVFLVVWKVFPKAIRTYVLGHELTHALWALLFGARVSKLHISSTGGSVKVSKSNFLITLSPYFFPFYTMVVVVIALITLIFSNPLPAPGVWAFIIGFTWCFHCCFTIQAMTQRQPDILEYGRMFSWSVIAILNLLWLIFAFTLSTPTPLGETGGILYRDVTAKYLFVFNMVNALINPSPIP